MKILKVGTVYGTTECPVYNCTDFPYNDYSKNIPYVRKLGKQNITYANIEAAFDIECTTVDSLHYKEVDCDNPFGFMYHWQFGIRHFEDSAIVCFGRTWEEYLEFIEKLSNAMELNERKRLVVFVHNLGYEFQFMRNFIQVDRVFAKDKRKPLTVLSKTIEYRCSYFLSNMSLAKFCENSEGCIFWKNVDTYDYKKFRTPWTPLTQEEESYCYCDVRGLCECIHAKMKEDNIANMPLTSTGYVRRDARLRMRVNPENRGLFEQLRLKPEHYTMLKRLFRGGDTHASRYFIDKTLENVHSFDRASSYPAVMMYEDFPMSPFEDIEITSKKQLYDILKNKRSAYIISMYDVQCKADEPFPYIDIAHCTRHHGIVNDNGRVLKADFIEYTCTDIDLEIILDTYYHKGFQIEKCIVAEKGKLPKDLRDTIMEYFFYKTTLKGNEEKIYEYMKSKNKLNGIFGMIVSAIDHDEYPYDSIDGWQDIKKSDVAKSLDSYYNSRNSFLSYQWGVWVTALARRELRKGMKVAGLSGIYSDTDSVKTRENVFDGMELLNKEIIEKCENNDIPAYVDYNGKRYYLGVWEYEGVYDNFKTLGSKKYCYTENGKFHITVAGLNKKLGAKAIGCIDNFKINSKWDGKEVGHNTSWFNDMEKPVMLSFDDCPEFSCGSNIGIMETDYIIGVTAEYWDIIENYSKKPIDISTQ